jgi:hypothetical protein
MSRKSSVFGQFRATRNNGGNPNVPDWLKEEYLSAIGSLAEKGISELPHVHDPETCRSILSVVALDRGLRTHARLLVSYSEDELLQMDLCEAK